MSEFFPLVFHYPELCVVFGVTESLFHSNPKAKYPSLPCEHEAELGKRPRQKPTERPTFSPPSTLTADGLSLP